MMNKRSGTMDYESIWDDIVRVRPCNKRGAEGIIDDRKEKKLKMDRGVKQQCSIILKTLMTHPAGWVFNEPVDPIALNIPDYFSVITEPMDLGTIKKKLEGYKYSSIYDFAADVRLTFSNAMRYNPPSNSVHGMAQELDNLFSRRWKSLVGGVGSEKKNLEDRCTPQSKIKNSQETEKIPKKRSTKVGFEARLVKVEITDKRRRGFSEKIVHKVTEKKACSFADTRQSYSSVNRHSYTYTSHESDISFETSAKQCQTTAEKDCEKANTATSDASVSDQDSHGVTPVQSTPLSPKTALRAAMLKSRYADTIFKAARELFKAEKVDPVTIMQEKERFKRQQQAEKARLDAEIKAAEAASRLKAEEESRRRREREREAARIALQKMEKTAGIYDNSDIIDFVEKLSVSSKQSPLQRLGLYMKLDYLEDGEDDDMPRSQQDYCEEGEILS